MCCSIAKSGVLGATLLDANVCAAQYKHYGLGTTIWSPLAYGLLSGKYGQGKIPEGSRFAMESYKVMRRYVLLCGQLHFVPQCLRPAGSQPPSCHDPDPALTL